jgi:Ty3 transposon capsid-like protein
LQFKDELIDRFNLDFKNPIDEFKNVRQTHRIDDYINAYERIKARVHSKQFSEEEFYLLGFLSGLKDEITDVVLLYNPTTLKQTYKLAKKIEKALDSQNRMLKPVVKIYTSTVSSKLTQSLLDKPPYVTYSTPKNSESSHSKSFSLDQKRTLGCVLDVVISTLLDTNVKPKKFMFWNKKIFKIPLTTPLKNYLLNFLATLYLKINHSLLCVLPNCFPSTRPLNFKGQLVILALQPCLTMRAHTHL